jgi:outer membrane lipoprotein SlyB
MFQKFTSYLSAILLALALTACATPSNTPGEVEIRSGVIEQITQVELSNSHPTGLGAVVGGIAGLGIGSLIGAGTGRDVAMVLGTVGGAIAGNQVQKHYERPEPGQQIIVRLTSGVLVSVTQPAVSGLFQGQKVFVEGSGENARVVPR